MLLGLLTCRSGKSAVATRGTAADKRLKRLQIMLPIRPDGNRGIRLVVKETILRTGGPPHALLNPIVFPDPCTRYSSQHRTFPTQLPERILWTVDS